MTQPTRKPRTRIPHPAPSRICLRRQKEMRPHRPLDGCWRRPNSNSAISPAQGVSDSLYLPNPSGYPPKTSCFLGEGGSEIFRLISRVQDGHKMAPRRPKTAQDDSRRPQNDPKTAQDGPKTAQDDPRRPQDSLRWPDDAKTALRRPQDGPRQHQDGPRRPKTAPRWLITSGFFY